MAQKSILITGCSSGIGLDAARTLRARGWHVLATCRAQEDCDRLTKEGLVSFPLDYADQASIEAGFAAALDHTGGTLDAVFNNGAYAIPGAVEDLPVDALRAIFDVNLFGYHALTCLAIKVMRQQGHGRIVQCSSVLGIGALRFRGAYNSTKFALEGLTDTLRLEMRGTGIHLALIEPGPITTKIRENSIPHFEKWIDVDGSARAAQYAVLKERLYTDTGKDRFELGPDAVTRKLIHAIESPRPKARYFVTTPTYLMEIFRRFLPTSWRDAIQSRL